MDKDYVIQTLATQLDDKTLSDMFPGMTPDVIRNLLLEHASGDRVAAHTQVRHKPMANIRCQLFTDGASRGNPGLAGAGIVLLDEQNQELLTKAEFLGRVTNNVAEYKALIIGLQAAGDMGCRHIDVFLDSELIVRQLSGRYKVKNATLKPLFAQAKTLLQEFEDFTASHIPRSKNTRADELANQGIDRQQNIGTEN